MKRLLFLVLLLAACDSNEPNEENTFAGKYISSSNTAYAELLLIDDQSSQFDYTGSFVFGSGITAIECTGNESTLSCRENPAKFSENSHTLSKTSDGLDMTGDFDIQFSRETFE